MVPYSFTKIFRGAYLASLGSNEESTPPKRVGLPITLEAILGMPTHGIEPQTRIYKIRVIPFNYAGWFYNARGNRTLVPCVKGKCINRYTMASKCMRREELNHLIQFMRLTCYLYTTSLIVCKQRDSNSHSF